jgi:hypothetical protein
MSKNGEKSEKNMRRRHYYFRTVERRVAIRQHQEYKALRRAIFQHLSARPTFVHHIDSPLIEQAARLFADWLYIEELLSSEEGKSEIWRFADALAKIHSMLISTLNELEITPKMRSKIFQDLRQDDEITLKLKNLMGSK